MSTQVPVPEPAGALATRERLLKIAFQLFHEQGFHATGVATILIEELQRHFAGGEAH